ncbi:O-linked N-acetylglucosamine transferase family protein [Paraburkholderia metrosideri]|uniref:protein O-GlcNAc transferase n=1 Tax=Paraburkholderia metrosideri TaxID=580937 RepID=A0ABN7HVH9_9BURK|nr:tetratricopeptide repeat protein [Paraburkholderia metrosideri]CAD6540145.1 Beta-barrel assembly-enhancing protease [Paraburkholderia metrosideri]
MTTDADLQQALTHHRAKRLPQAERLYRDVLQARPDHPVANHNLGVMAIQTGQPGAGLPFLKAAVEAAPKRAEFWSLYLDALVMTGRDDEAQQVAELGRQRGLPLHAVRIEPVDAPATTPRSDADLLADEFILTIETLDKQNMHADAETLARQMTGLLPTHGYGWKALAYAHLRRGDLASALHPLGQAAACLPADADLGCHLHAARAMQDALALEQRGELREAGKRFEAVHAIYPEHPLVNHRLGVISIRLNQSSAAVEYMERAIGGDPNNCQYWANYIDALLQTGELKAAWMALEMGQQRGLKGPEIDKLIGVMTMMSTPATYTVQRMVDNDAPSNARLSPAFETQPAAANTPAASRRSNGKNEPSKAEIAAIAEMYNTDRTEEAIAAARNLVDVYPSHGFGWKLMAISLHRLGRYDQAMDYCATARELCLNDIDLLQVSASVLESKGEHDQAEADCRKILEINPNHQEGLRILGIVLISLGRLEEAERVCLRAVDVDPNAPLPYSTLGVTYMKLGNLDKAATQFRRAIELNPNGDLAYDNLAFCMTHSENTDPAELFATHRMFGEQFETLFKPNWPQHSNSKDPERRLRIGFTSGDFCRHAVASFFEPILDHLALNPRLSLHAYSNTSINDQVTERMRGKFERWHHVFGMKDDAVAKLIAADEIDILIDLAGHTANNCLLSLARKPAPIQASWIGYPGTTGLSAVDYFLADRHWVPSDQFRDQFTEKIVYLPALAPFKADSLSPPVNLLPAQRNGYITFGSFNRMDKLRREVIALWSRLMHAVPNSRMLIGAMPGDGSLGDLVEWFAEEGIARERLDFRSRASVPVYLQQHYHVDICLDTFPFSGLTTALHSLWMGVPTLTLPGKTVPGRSGLTAMSHAGLDMFITTDKDDFVRRGVALTSDIPALAALRAGMRERCERSPMFRPAQIAESVSEALRAMWRRWCVGLSAESFEVKEAAAEEVA